MPSRTLTVQLPEYLYRRIERRAASTQRSVEDEAVDALASALPDADEIPAALAEQIACLDRLDDDALRQAARARLSDAEDARLKELNEKGERQGLTEDEAREAAALIDHGETFMVIRAKAALLLKQRGQDISDLLPD